jgi:hypothetical protein
MRYLDMCIRGLEAAPDVADSGICHALEVCKRRRSSSSATLTGSSLESEYICPLQLFWPTWQSEIVSAQNQTNCKVRARTRVDHLGARRQHNASKLATSALQSNDLYLIWTPYWASVAPRASYTDGGVSLNVWWIAAWTCVWRLWELCRNTRRNMREVQGVSGSMGLWFNMIDT